MDLKQNLGKNIQSYRKLNRMTQEKLAELVDVEINSISSIERGKYFPSPENLVKISKALNVPLSDLFTFEPKYTSEDYMKEILSNIEFIKDDPIKLRAVSLFIKNILSD